MVRIVDGTRISKEASRRKSCEAWDCSDPATHYVTCRQRNGLRYVLAAYCKRDAREGEEELDTGHKAIPRRKLDEAQP